MPKLKTAVIGAGWWSTTAHIPALKKHPQAELIGVQKRDRAAAQKVAADFDIPHACTTAEEILALPGLQAVVIGSTPNAHYSQCRMALEKGLHVLIEKPMTLKAGEARELVALAQAKGVQFLISCPWHYTAHGLEAQRLIREGRLGDLKMISVLMTNFTKGLYEGLPWDQVFGKNPTLQNSAKPYIAPGQSSYSDTTTAGGGQIYCQVSHAAAYIGYLTGRKPAEVFARFDNGSAPVDVYDVLNIKMDDGCLVSLASTGATMLSERNYEVRIYGTKGMILLELWKGTMEFHDENCQVTRLPDIPDSDIYPMYAPAENLVTSALGLEPNRSPALHGLVSMEIIEAACQSAQTHHNVRIA